MSSFWTVFCAEMDPTAKRFWLGGREGDEQKMITEKEHFVDAKTF